MANETIAAACVDAVKRIKAGFGRSEEADHVWAMAMQDSRLHLLWECVQATAIAAEARDATEIDDAKRRYRDETAFHVMVRSLAQGIHEDGIKADDIRQALLLIENSDVGKKSVAREKRPLAHALSAVVQAGLLPEKNGSEIAKQIAESCQSGQIVAIPNERFDLTVAEVKDGTPVCYCPFCGHASMCLTDAPADHGRGTYYCNRGCTPTPKVPTGFHFTSHADFVASFGSGNPPLVHGMDATDLRKGELLASSWSTSSTNIRDNLRQVKESALQQTGYEESSRETTADYTETPAPSECTCSSLLNGHENGCPLAGRG